MSNIITQRNQDVYQAAKQSAIASVVIGISIGDPLELVTKKALMGAGSAALCSLFLAPIAENIFPDSTLKQHAALLTANYFLKKEVQKITDINPSTDSHFIANFAQLVLWLESKKFLAIY